MRRVILSWGYGQRYLLELVFVIGIWGVLTYFAATLLPGYISNVYLTEPVGLSRNIQTHMLIDSAFTGRWPDNASLSHLHDGNPKEIRAISINEHGNINFHLQYDAKGIDAHNLAFNLGTLDAGYGFLFYSWYCGDSKPSAGYVTQEKIDSSVDFKYSHTVCRN